MRHIVFFFILLSSIKSYTQEPTHYIIGKEIFDGVHLYSIIQDSTDNSMWITSNKGIYNYNGITFTHHIPKSSKSSALFGLTKDSKGNIYCFNLNGQIFKLHNKKFELYYTINDPDFKNIYIITFDNTNNLLVGSGGNITLIPPNKKNVSLIKKNMFFLTKNKDKVYFFKKVARKNNFNLIKRYNNKEEIIGKNYKEMSSLFFAQNKPYIFNYFKGNLFKVARNSLKKLHHLSFLKTGGFKPYNIGENLWFCNHKKGVFIIPKTDFEAQKKHTKLFKDYTISGGIKDSEGNTWLLTFNNGIINIPNLKNTIIKPPNNSNFKAITKANNKLYIATENGQIYKLYQHKFSPFFELNKNDRIEHLKVFPKQKCIVSSERIYMNNSSKKTPFCRDAIWLKDSLLLGLPSGLHSYNLQSKQLRNLSGGRTYDIYYDTTTKKTWFTTNNGLKQYKNGTTTNITYKGKEILKAKTLAVNNQIWVASKNGVYIFKNDSITQHITQKDGLLTNDIDNIKYEHPNIYLASKKGMQRYNINYQTFTDFTFSDGLTKRISQFEVLNDTVYAINSDGLLTFTFNNQNENIKRYNTQITKATANGTIQINNNDILEANENNLHFSFLTTTFKYQKELRYQYQLIGIDKKPIKAIENQLSANYGNVPSGNYTFVVDSFLGDTPNKSAVLNFAVKEIWYQTLWLKLIIIGVSLLTLYYIYKTRLNAIIRKRDKEKMQKQLAESSLTSLKAQMNPHFLFNAMNSIQSLIINKQNDEAYSYLTQLSNLVRENLKMSDVSFVPFVSELKLIKKYLELEKLRFEETLTYTVENNISNSEVLIPSMIIQPFIENAIKHGLLHKKDNRFLSVQFKQSEKVINCIITDNGIGRKASEKLQQKRKYKSFSTNAIQKRFTILKEYYKIDIGFTYEDLYENNVATGTKVTIKIPFTDEFNE